ncbi:MAG: hypothetical protein JNL55_27255, partial [Steroidobacter sp.]|nr:hypothetical protein [Steroidobacter sp.]
GMLADFVVLSADLFSIPADQIPKIKALRTVIGGKERYLAPGQTAKP